jgi:hypothetical protein
MPITAYYHPGFAAPLGAHVMPIDKFARVPAALRDEPRVNLDAPARLDESDLLSACASPTPAHRRPRTPAESQKFPGRRAVPSVC